MSGWAWGFLGAAAVLAVGDWLAVARRWTPVEYACKPGTLLALLAVASSLDPAHGDTRVWFVIALGWSLVGDVLLMLPSARFVAGLAAFLVAHVAYTVGLTRHGGAAGLVALCALPVLVVAIALTRRFLRAALARGHRALVGPLVAYMLAISAMVAVALAGGSPAAAVGAVLFFGSDALIGETRFVAVRRGAPVLIMVTYHLGQAALTLSLLG